jgi:hypothetical protein
MSVSSAYTDSTPPPSTAPACTGMTLEIRYTQSGSSKGHLSGYQVKEGCKIDHQSASLELDFAVKVNKQLEQMSFTIDTDAYPADAANLLAKINEIGMTGGLSKEDKKELQGLLPALASAKAQSDANAAQSDLAQIANQFETYLRSAK